MGDLHGLQTAIPPLTPRCTKHPTYRGLRRPRVDCQPCRDVYEHNQKHGIKETRGRRLPGPEADPIVEKVLATPERVAPRPAPSDPRKRFYQQAQAEARFPTRDELAVQGQREMEADADRRLADAYAALNAAAPGEDTARARNEVRGARAARNDIRTMGPGAHLK